MNEHEEWTPELQQIRDNYDALLDVLYAHCGAGGQIHILTEDGNEDDHHLEFCRQYVNKNEEGFPSWLCHLQLAILDLVSLTNEKTKSREYVTTGIWGL